VYIVVVRISWGECAGVGGVVFGPGTLCNSDAKADLLAITGDRSSGPIAVVGDVIIKRAFEALDEAFLNGGTAAARARSAWAVVMKPGFVMRQLLRD